jgi:signal transduction histidine kinase
MSRFSLLTAWAVVATGLLVLLGWAFDIATLKSVIPGFPMMKANTALGFVLVGVGLTLLHNEGTLRSRLLARFCGIATALLGVLTLGEYVSGRDLHIDDLLFRSAANAMGASVSRMSPAAALNFTIFGVTLQWLTAKRPAALGAVDALLMLAMLIGMIALAGYLYSVTALYQFRVFSAMAVHTAVVFVALAAALLAAPPRRGVAAFLAGDDLGANMARRLLPVAVMVPPLVGYVRLIGQRKGYYGTELGLALFATSNVVIFIAVIFGVALSLRRADLKRRASDKALHVSFGELSERKKVEQQLIKTMKELERSNRELEQFSYVASHDLQEPLRMVVSYMQLLSNRYKGRLDSDADEFIAYAVDGTNRMQQLIRDLLTYSRVGSGAMALRSISSELALHMALTNLQTSIEESGAVVTHDSLPAVTTNETQLSQVFQNLVGNAIKYRSAEVPRIHISATTNGSNEWIFSVRDNGLGIAPEHFERVFVLFARLHRREEIAGTGIGLAICKKMLEGLGGRIWVESQLEKGSTFRFTLADGVASA